MYDAHAFLNANGEHQAFQELTGIVVSEADYIKIRRFGTAIALVGMCDALDKSKS